MPAPRSVPLELLVKLHMQFKMRGRESVKYNVPLLPEIEVRKSPGSVISRKAEARGLHTEIVTESATLNSEAYNGSKKATVA